MSLTERGKQEKKKAELGEGRTKQCLILPFYFQRNFWALGEIIL